MGFGAEAMRPGDVVAVLFGCSFPVLLRPSGDGFRLIKACYVHGIMDGEAIVEHEQGKLPGRTFMIR